LILEVFFFSSRPFFLSSAHQTIHIEIFIPQQITNTTSQ